MAVSINVQAEVWKALRGVGGESGILRAEFCRFSVLWGPVCRGLAGGSLCAVCESSGSRLVVVCYNLLEARPLRASVPSENGQGHGGWFHDPS